LLARHAFINILVLPTGKSIAGPRMRESLATLSARLRAGELCVRELAERAAHRHASADLGAYREFRDQDEPGITEAQRLLDAGKATALTGIPISVKDLFGVPGFRTFAGTARALPTRFERAGSVVTTLLRQGALVMGKTHTVEFAFGGLGLNAHFPTPINPFSGRTPRVPGGSSSGAGVSLCEGSCYLAIGTDTAGSVRIPAAMTGNAGLKLTAGRWPLDGVVPLSPTLDSPGLLARSVSDLALAFAALDPTDQRPVTASLATARLAWANEDVLWHCSPGIAESVRAAIDELRAKGASIAPAAWPEALEALTLFERGSPAGLELHAFLARELPDWRSTLDPNVAARLPATTPAPADLSARVAAIAELQVRARARLLEVDAFLLPTVAVTPPTLAELATPERYRALNVLSLRNTSIANYLGACSLTLPVGLDVHGMPVGLQLVGAPRSEARLLALGVALEAALGPIVPVPNRVTDS
jgi:aspartyl-tRNA(Asn)/glutamyl-tRNA(Gln) amidotransferase subunit A